MRIRFRASKVDGAIALLIIALLAIRVPAADQVAKATADIVRARDYTASYVALAKRVLKNDDLTQAEKLYADAYSKYGGWNAYIETALRDGKAKKITTDESYQKLADDATAAATKFVGFVDTKTGQTKSILAILSQLADLGLKVWNGVKDRKTKDRNAAADSFAKATKWSAWNDIKGGT